MEKVKFNSENGISTITLNRPNSFNALDSETLESFLQILNDVKENEDSVVIITGEGRAFCAGGDIQMISNITESQFDQLMDTIERITTILYVLPKIVIVAANGSTAGLGLSLALNSDYIVAHEKAKFGMLFAGIGLFPDGGGHFFLKERLGTHQAKQFIWSMKQVDGKSAKELGLVDILAEEDVVSTAIQLAQSIQQSPIKAIIQSKLILHESKLAELNHYLRQEKDGQLKLAQTKDHAEGVSAFLEKRKPRFIGK